MKSLPFVVITLSILLVVSNITNINARNVNALFPLEFREDLTVQMPKETISGLAQLYLSSSTEYLYCLIGKKEGNNYVITSIEEVESVKEKSTVTSKEEIPCQGDKYIGTLHKHPYGGYIWRILLNDNRQPSKNDIYSSGLLRKPLHIVQYSPFDLNAREYQAKTILDTRSIEVISK